MSLHLLDLPVEILRQILRPLLTAPESITLCPCRRRHASHQDSKEETDDDDDEPPPPAFFAYPVLPILLIHPRLHAVACPLLYEANRFILDLTGPHHMHIRRWTRHRDAATAVTPVERRQEDYSFSSPSTALLLPPTLLGTTDALRRIPNLAIRLDRLRSWIQDAVVPPVADMTLRGSLRSLEIQLTAVRAPRMDALLRPPLSGLVGLLSDPYLDSARLRILGNGGGGDGWDPWKVAGKEGDGDGEVDWRALVRAVDPEGTRFPDVAGGVQRGRYYC